MTLIYYPRRDRHEKRWDVKKTTNFGALFCIKQKNATFAQNFR